MLELCLGALPRLLALYACLSKAVHSPVRGRRPAADRPLTHTRMPRKIRTPIKKFKLFFREIWVSDPGTGPIGFVSKFRAVSWYLCVRNSDMDPDRTNIDFGTTLPIETGPGTWKRVKNNEKHKSGHSYIFLKWCCLVYSINNMPTSITLKMQG